MQEKCLRIARERTSPKKKRILDAEVQDTKSEFRGALNQRNKKAFRVVRCKKKALGARGSVLKYVTKRT